MGRWPFKLLLSIFSCRQRFGLKASLGPVWEYHTGSHGSTFQPGDARCPVSRGRYHARHPGSRQSDRGRSYEPFPPGSAVDVSTFGLPEDLRP